MAPSPVAIIAYGGSSAVTLQDSIVAGATVASGAVAGAIVGGGLVSDATTQLSEILDATPQASLVDGYTPHGARFLAIETQQSEIADAVSQDSFADGGQSMRTEVEDFVLQNSLATGATPQLSFAEGGIVVTSILQGNRAQTSEITGHTPHAGFFTHQGVFQSSVIFDFTPGPFFPYGTDNMDTQCVILGAQEDPGHPLSNTWSIASTDALNTEKRTLQVMVPWPMARRPCIIVWRMRGFFLNTSVTPSTFGFALHKDTAGVTDATPFYQFTTSTLPSNTVSPTSGAFTVEIMQLIGGPALSASVQNIRALGFFNPGNLVALGGAGHGATTFMPDISRSTTAFQFDADRWLTMSVKKLTGPVGAAGVTMRADSVHCIAYPSSGMIL